MPIGCYPMAVSTLSSSMAIHRWLLARGLIRSSYALLSVRPLLQDGDCVLCVGDGWRDGFDRGRMIVLLKV